jgi:hypothetical protein
MKKSKTKSNIGWDESLAAVLAFIFVYSVITNVQDFVATGVQNSPNNYALIGGVALVVYSFYKTKKLSLLSSQTVMAIVTAVSIWGFGLHGWLG